MNSVQAIRKRYPIAGVVGERRRRHLEKRVEHLTALKANRQKGVNQVGLALTESKARLYGEYEPKP